MRENICGEGRMKGREGRSRTREKEAMTNGISKEIGRKETGKKLEGTISYIAPFAN